jgi:hypothetical protein
MQTTHGAERMSPSRHFPTDQEQAQAERVEAMRLYRERQAETQKAAAPPASEPAQSSKRRGENYARVKVRGTPDDAETERALQSFENSVRADAEANGGVVPPQASQLFDKTVARLTGDPAPPPVPSDTETELNGLIAECRYLMREIAFNSARLTYDPDDRIRFLSSAESLALTAAKIGRSVAQIRAAGREPGAVETHRHEMVYTHVATAPLLPPSLTDSAKQ